MRKIDLIVVHCTASKCTTHLTPFALDQLHRRRGFNGCGYHFYVTMDGEIHTMRPIDMPGAHAKGHNATSIGIAYEGGLNGAGKPADTRTGEQRRSLCHLIDELKQKFPGCHVCGHRDLSPDINHNGKIEPFEYIKMCPCFDAIEEYNGI